ncbi:MAG: adenylosuccinate synthetase [Candidatus Nanoarchaeia archaeon]|nr:adenylosuccinate synthetase [Candidatus Nanoarchaeia archaeon]MDD5740725.1 adenylosuccinate synthetase [Candidatus Nanoarchaeia archaeon]
MALVDILVGLQWGSEGKGKIAAYLSSNYKAMVRSGGPQAGHTFYDGKTKFVNRQVPCGVFNKGCFLYISPAAIINIDVLREEIKRYNLTPQRLIIDRQATVISQNHIRNEKDSSLQEKLASTQEGVGAAQADKIWRRAILLEEYAKETMLMPYCGDTILAVHEHIKNEEPVLLEGTQGHWLSLNHGLYPYVTSRDVTASALLNDAGIPPQQHRKTIGVMRTYPIRVGGNSGPTGSKEISWKEIEQRSDSKKKIIEFTSVTGRIRRVFEQNIEFIQRAIMINQPDELALMFLDYINAEDYGKSRFVKLSKKSKDYIYGIERELQIPVTLIGTGPLNNHIIEKRE